MNPPSLENESSFKDYLYILKRRRWIVLSFCIITTVVVTIASFVMTPLFRATATIIVEGEDTDILKSTESSSAAVSFDIFENYIQTQMTIILSRSVAGKVFNEFKLGELKWYKHSSDPVKTFIKNNIQLERLKGTRIIKISIDDPEPQRAADMANRLAEIYSQENLMRRALTVIRNQRMGSLNAEYLRLQSKLDALSNQYGPKHPEMIAIKEEIRMMAKRMQSEKLAAQNSLEKPINSEEQQMLEDILLQIQENSVMSSSRMNNVMIADSAVVPTRRDKPKRLLNMVIGFIGGLVGGVFFAFVVNYLDDTIKTDEEVKKYLGQSVVFLGSLFSEKHKAGNSTARKNIDQLVHLQSNSPSAETYRLVRMGILWFASKDGPIKDFAVLSPGPGEGKTTVASNIAIALSQVNHRVLLVDTDIRRGRLHESYGVSNDKGLGQYLMGNLSADAVIKRTEIPNLSLVTCGESVIDSSQLLSSKKMAEFIQETRKRFDTVIYDTPPVALISDTSILISQIDSAFLVIRSGTTTIRMFSKALEIIKESKTRLIGVVMNDASFSDEKSYYGKYYKKT